MKNILIITYWSYKDALIQTYTLPYVQILRKNLSKDQKVFLVTLEQVGSKMSNGDWLNEKKKSLKHNIHLIRFSYSNFGPLMILKFPYIFLSLLTLILTKKISHIHTWCTPAGAIGYILSLITKKKLILDSYEPHAEPMVESGTWEVSSWKFKILFWLEKKQVQRATHVITCVESMKTYVKDKFQIDLKNTYAKPACIDFELFNINNSKNKDLINKYKLDGKTIGVYAGKFEGSYLKDEVFEFLKVAENFWGKKNFRFIILTNHSTSFVEKMRLKYNIDKATIIQLFVPHKEVPQYIGLSDFGISPFIPVPSKRYGSPIKNGEYWAMGLPVVITKDISDDSEIIEKKNIGYVLQNLNNKEYNNACKKINLLIQNKEILNPKIKKIAEEYRNFEIAENIYKGIYSNENSKANNRNILILTYWSYQDALIQTYTLPYVRIIRENLNKKSKIYLFTLEQKFYRMTDSEWESEKLKLLNENIHIIRFKYSHFGLKMALRLWLLMIALFKLIKKNEISTIHSWCTPAGSIGYILSKFTKAKLIIDSYEPHAESMVENGTWAKSSLKFKLLFWLEKKQSQQADTVIALTSEMKNYAKNKYNAIFSNYYIKPALVNSNKFNWDINNYTQYRLEEKINDKIVCLYTGKLGGIYLEEEVFDFIKKAYEYWNGNFVFYFLTDYDKEAINEYLIKKNIPSNCVRSLFVPYKDIHYYFQLADFAINPVKPVPSKRYCTSIKDGEYWAMGLPVIITKNISDDSDIIQNENIGYVLQELSEIEYKNACDKIQELLNQKGTGLRGKIKTISKKYRSYSIAERMYKELYA